MTTDTGTSAASDYSLGRRAWRWLVSWVDTSVGQFTVDPTAPRRVHWARVLPLLFLHLGCLGVIWSGWSPVAVAVAVALLLSRIFFVTAFYHRYFSHKSFDTSRAAQFVFAVLGNTAVQRGPLWWAAHHRNHHSVADAPGDPHSPHRYSLYWSHVGWITDPNNFPTRLGLVKDLARFPELRWLDRFDTAVGLAVMALLYGLGAALQAWAPGLGTSGGQMVVWGFFISTVCLFHVTSLVNSGAHTFGRKRFPAKDESRNSFLIALLTFGEGWHNNHHYYPAAARQGFYWWELDITYYLLRLLAATGVIWNVREVPGHVLALGRGSGGGSGVEKPAA